MGHNDRNTIEEFLTKIYTYLCKGCRITFISETGKQQTYLAWMNHARQMMALKDLNTDNVIVMPYNAWTGFMIAEVITDGGEIIVSDLLGNYIMSMRSKGNDYWRAA